MRPTPLLLAVAALSACAPGGPARGVDSTVEDRVPASTPNRAVRPTLRAVGDRGFHALDGPFAVFDPGDPTVEVWTPPGTSTAPVVVYAHGGGGYREDDRARVALFRRNGFATISFDAYEMNGFDDWEFVARQITNGGKQAMIWNVFRGAVAYAKEGERWDDRRLVFYGGSNGARVVLFAGAELDDPDVRAIVAEAPAASGLPLGALEVPTLIPFGALDSWAGRSATDYVWSRTYPTSPVSIEAWANELRDRGRPIRLVFYENAGHLLFAGPLREVTVRRGRTIAFTSYEGAGPGVLEQYERDVIDFVNRALDR